MTAGDLKGKKRKVVKRNKKKTASKKQSLKKAKEFSDVRDMIDEVLELVGIVIRRFAGKIRFRFNKLDITVATHDAALTALSYSFVCNSLDILIEILSDKDKVNCEFIDPSVKCDFLAEQFSASVDILVSIKIWQAILGAVQTITDKLKTNI